MSDVRCAYFGFVHVRALRQDCLNRWCSIFALGKAPLWVSLERRGLRLLATTTSLSAKTENMQSYGDGGIWSPFPRSDCYKSIEEV